MEGADCLIKYFPEEEEDAHEKKVEDHGCRCCLYPLANIITRESCKKLADEVVAEMRVIDISFNICLDGI